MVRFLLHIKRNFKFLWLLIEGLNGIIFQKFYASRIEKHLPSILEKANTFEVEFRELFVSDIEALHQFIKTQSEQDLEFFKPHELDLKSLYLQKAKPAFLMMGAFIKGKIVGYFFLRLFANKKCFVGRLVDKDFRNKGVGKGMNFVMYELSWYLGFRCLSTISKNNESVMNAHFSNSSMIVLKELQNQYLLVEFVKEDQ